MKVGRERGDSVSVGLNQVEVSHGLLHD